MRLNLYFLTVLLMLAVIFLAGIKPGQKNYFIDDALPNKVYLENQLIQNKNYDSSTFYLFSHGKVGSLQMEGKYLKNNELANYIQNLIKDKNFKQINIYGCEFAKGKEGKAAVEFLENQLHVKISASDDLTGKTGDWDLEVGEKQPVLSFPKYNYNLQCTANYEYDFTGKPSYLINATLFYGASDNLFNDVMDTGVSNYSLKPVNQSATWGFGIDLGQDYAFTSVDLYKRLDCCGNRLLNGQILLYNDGALVYASPTINETSNITNIDFGSAITADKFEFVYPNGTATGTGEYISNISEIDFYNLMPDNDCDGIEDNADLDDDNDGILDDLENSLVTAESAGTFGTSNTSLNRNLETPVGGSYNYAPGANNGGGQYAVINGYNDGWHNFFNTLTGHTTGTQDDAFLAVNGSVNVGIFYSQSVSLLPNTTYDLGLWAANAVPAAQSASYPCNLGVRLKDQNGNIVAQSSTGSITDSHIWHQANINYTTSSNTQYTFEVYNVSTGASGNDFAIDDIYFQSASGGLDSDGDGIDNYLDLDSDNDGCPDAIEGGAGFDYSALNDDTSLSGDVDADGVPLSSGGGQAIGSSIDNTVLAEVCLNCDTNLSCWELDNSYYQIYNGTGIMKLDPITETYSSFATISAVSDTEALAINSEDGKLYAVASINGVPTLVTIDRDGSIHTLDLTFESMPIGGSIDDNGNYYVLYQDGTVTMIDLNASTLSESIIASTFTGVEDIAISNGNIIGIDSSMNLLSYDIGTGSTSTTALSGAITSDSADFSTIWANDDGSIFVYNNVSGKIYSVNSSTNITTQVSNTSSGSSFDDGFNYSILNPPIEGNCSDGVDNDGDGLIDCADGNCDLDNACLFENCTNGIDDDNDGFIDCEDSECYTTISSCQEICDNGIDDNGDGLIDGADPQCTASAGVNEGLDSNNRLSDKIAKRNQQRVLRPSNSYLAKLKGEAGKPIQMRDGNFQIQNLLPYSMNNLESQEATPDDLPQISNAVMVAAIDYYDNGNRVGGVLGIKSENGVYEHTKYICDRLEGSKLLDISYIFIGNGNLLQYEIQNTKGQKEYATTISGYVLNDEFYLENHWNIYNYPADHDYYTVQVRANSQALLQQLVFEVLARFQQENPIVDLNWSYAPKIFISSGIYKNGQLFLNIKNKDRAALATVAGQFRRVEGGEPEDFNQTINLSVTKEENLLLNIGYIYDFGFALQSENSVNDDLFIADGTWMIDDVHSGIVVDQFNIEPHINSELALTEDCLLLERSIEFEGKVRTYANITRSLSAKFSAKNMNDFQSIAFEAKGSGTLELTVVKDGIEDWQSQYRLQIDLDPEQKTYYFSREDFKSGLGGTIDFNDVKMLVFTLVGDGSNIQNRFLNIENLRFTNAERPLGEIPANDDKWLSPNPTSDISKLIFDTEIETVKVYNVFGQIVLQKEQIAQKRMDLSLGHLTTGIYIVEVKLKNGEKKTAKLVRN